MESKDGVGSNTPRNVALLMIAFGGKYVTVHQFANAPRGAIWEFRIGRNSMRSPTPLSTKAFPSTVYLKGISPSDK